jgi:capsular polysaccharide biosynthesis protein
MGVVGALRTLWRRRIIVAAIGVFAVFIGLYVAYSFSPPTSLKSRQYHVANGSASALIDSPKSQVVDLGSADALGVDVSSLDSRATLLASLMTSSPLKEEIAAKAGINPTELIAISPAMLDPAPGTPVVLPDTSNPNSKVLRATIPTLSSGQVPMIQVSTQAPEPGQAARLANAAFAVLQKHLQDVAATDGVPAGRRVTVRQLGPATASESTRGPGKKMAVVFMVLIGALGCGAILLLEALVGGWRAARELERDPLPPPSPVIELPLNGHEANGHAPVHAPKVPRPPAVPAKARNWASP